MPTEIDARIPLQVRTPEIHSPLESYGRALQISNMIDIGRERELRIMKERREEEEERAIREAYRLHVLPDGTPDWDKIRTKIYRINPLRAAKLDEEVAQRARDKAELERKQQDALYQRQTRFAQSLSGIKTGDDFKVAIYDAVARGDLTKDEATRWLARPWNDETAAAIDQIRRRTMTVAQQDAARLAEERAALAQLKDARDRAHDAAELERIQAATRVQNARLAGDLPMNEYQKKDLELKKSNQEAQQAGAAETRKLREETKEWRELRQVEQLEAKLREDAREYTRQLYNQDLSPSQRATIENLLRDTDAQLDTLMERKRLRGWTTKKDTERRKEVAPPKASSWRDALSNVGNTLSSMWDFKFEGPAADWKPQGGAPAPVGAPPETAPAAKPKPAPASALPEFDEDFTEAQLDAEGKAAGMTPEQIRQLKAHYLTKRKYKTIAAPPRKPEKKGTAASASILDRYGDALRSGRSTLSRLSDLLPFGDEGI